MWGFVLGFIFAVAVVLLVMKLRRVSMDALDRFNDVMCSATMPLEEFEDSDMPVEGDGGQAELEGPEESEQAGEAEEPREGVSTSVVPTDS